MTAKSNSERQQALRDRRAKLGLKRVEFFLNDQEKLEMTKLYTKLIKNRGNDNA